MIAVLIILVVVAVGIILFTLLLGVAFDSPRFTPPEWMGMLYQSLAGLVQTLGHSAFRVPNSALRYASQY